MSQLSGKKDVWTVEENSAIVEAYFEMLTEEIAGRPYSKTAVRRRLQKDVLLGRSDASIEFKLQNISAILDEHIKFFLTGYRPAINVQNALRDAVEKRLRVEGLID